MHYDDSTIIRRPTPGGGRPSYTPTGRHPYTATDASRPSIPRVDAKGLNPLVESATTLLSLAAQLSTKSDDQNVNVNELREHVNAEIKSFTRTATDRGIDRELVNKASYVLCAFLDEAVMNTPWGRNSSWPSEQLTSKFHGDTWGGVKFFDILQECRADPYRNLGLLKLMYLCLAFGFRGKYHDKEYELKDIRNDLYDQIQKQEAEIDQALSPHWQGIDRRGASMRHLPWWVVVVVTLALLVVIYIGFEYSITDVSYPVYGQLENIQPKLMMDLQPPRPRPPFDPPYHNYILKFVTRGARLTDAHRQVVQTFIDRVNANRAYHNIGVEILGRASPTPPGADRYNQKLSEKRAWSVFKYLKGTDNERLPTVKVVSVKGLGAYNSPLQPRAGETHNEINQSVEILVVHQKTD